MEFLRKCGAGPLEKKNYSKRFFVLFVFPRANIFSIGFERHVFHCRAMIERLALSGKRYCFVKNASTCDIHPLR